MASKILAAALAAGDIRPAAKAAHAKEAARLKQLLDPVPPDPFQNKKALGGRAKASEPAAQHIDGQGDSPSFANQVQQADLLKLPRDPATDEEYVLVVVDLFTRRVGAVGLQALDSRTTQLGFAAIYRDDPHLPPPDRLELDGGSEFQGSVVLAYLARLQGPSGRPTFVRVGRPGRSKQASLAENVNRILGDAVTQLQQSRELSTEKVDRAWSANLAGLVKHLNAQWFRSPEKQKELAEQQEKAVIVLAKPRLKAGKPSCRTADGKKTASCTLLAIGTKVYLAQEHSRPKDTFGKKLVGTLRSGDLKFGAQEHIVDNIIFTPARLPRYLLEGIKGTSFSRQELRPVRPA